MDGARLAIRVQPKSSRNEIVADGGGRLKIFVTAPPDRGKANDAALSLLAKRLRVPKSAVRILRGHRTRSKVIVVAGLEARSVMARLGPTRQPGAPGV